MKITFATTWDSRCGVAVYSHSLTAELKKRVEIEIVSLDPDVSASPAEVAERLNRGDIAHVQHQYPFFGGMAVHRNWFDSMLSCITSPLVVTVHELDLGESDPPLMWKYKQWFNKRLFCSGKIDRFVVHTREYRDKLKELGVEPADIRVIPEGVPRVLEPSVSMDDAKSELGLANKRVLMLFGFVVRRKGYRTALEAICRLPEDVALLIAGGSHPGDRTGFFEGLKDWIMAEGLSDRVVVTGYLPEQMVPCVMAATDIVIAPFKVMGNSSSILRSMAYGKPVVASDLPVTREINERQQCLTLFRAGDPEDLASKVLELLEDEQKRADAVAAVRSYAETWSVARAAADTLTVYQELLER